MRKPAANGLSLLLAVGIAGGAVFLALQYEKRSGAPRPDTSRTASGSGRPAEGPANTPAGRPTPSRPDDAASREEADIFASFDSWTSRFLIEQDPLAQRGMIVEGIAIAEERRRALYALIATDPEAALRAAVPWGVRRALPIDVDQWLEKRVGGIGDFSVLGALPAEETPTVAFAPVRREAVVSGETYEAHVYGRRTQLPSTRAIALHGIAVGDRFAVLDSPLRLLEAGEPLPADRLVDEFCAVSGKPAAPGIAPAAQEVIAADLGDRVVYLCSAGHISVLAAQMAEDEVASAGGGGTAASVAPAIEPVAGVRRLLVIRVRFSDQASSHAPQSESGVADTVAAANAFFAENSSGRYSLAATVTPVYALPKSANWYASNDSSGYAKNVFDAALAVASDPESVSGNSGLPAFDPADFDLEVVRYSGGPGSFSGQGYIGTRGIWMKTDSAGVLAHEICHNLGLWHANAWETNDAQSAIGPGRNVEYGDVFDTMGRNSGAHRHLNTYEKYRLGWVSAESVAAVDAEGGSVRIHAHDLGDTTSASTTYAVKVRRDDDRDLWIEFRNHPAWSANDSIASGLGLRWDPWLSSNGGTQLLDATPFSRDGFSDSPLVTGRTFSDPAAAVHVTPLSRSGAFTETMDVDIRLGARPGNRPPVVSLTASAAEGPVGASVSFNAGATDPDGDALAYSWDFDDRSIGANAPSAAHSWAVAGTRRVRVTVSDRNGMTAFASVLVRVGNPSGTVIRGAVVALDGSPVANARVHNGMAATSPAFREAHTDSDGSFALTDLPEGSWSIGVEKPGWIFARNLFLNPVITPGDGSEIGFLGHRAGYRIAGVVRAADGTLVRGALVTIGGASEPTDSNGAFTFQGFESGRYEIQASKPGRSFASVTADVSFADVTNVEVAERSFTISGRLRGADPGKIITVTDGARSTTALAQPVGGGTEAAFALTRIAAGRRHIVAFTSSMSFSADNFAIPIEVDGDVSGLILARDETMGRFISGRITADGEGVPGISVIADGRSAVTDAAGRYFITELPAGQHTVVPAFSNGVFEPASRAVSISGSSVTNVDFSATLTNTAPVFTQPPAATGPLERPFVALSTRADDNGGAAGLKYTWSSVGAAPAPVSFSVNSANAARDTVALFAACGTYTLRATVTDGFNASASRDFTLTIRPVAARIAIEPAPHPIWLGGTARFSLACTDQFGAVMAANLPVAWQVSGGGTIDAGGLFTATRAGEGFVVSAAMGGRKAALAYTVGYPPGPGLGITQEMWTGLTGSHVAQLVSASAFPARPNHTSVLRDLLETPTGFEHEYGQRLRGYFVPPATGEYVFYIASDNSSELWLSDSSDPAGRTLIASVPGRTYPRDWAEFPSQQSAPLVLTEGRAVYIEVLHKEDSSDDHLAVGVKLPGGVYERPIPAHRLLPWGEAAFAPPQIVVEASASPAIVGSSLSTALSVTASSEGGAEALTFRWEATSASGAPVVFLPNGTHSAQSAVARFARAGVYTLRVVVADNAGQSASSTVEVTVRETHTSWRRRFFTPGELDSPALEARRWGANADPDGDGVSNLLEYAFGLDPLVPAPGGVPVSEMITVDGVEYLAVTFQRNPEASDLEYTPQASSDLENWESGMIPVGDPAANPATFRDSRPARELDKRFVRVHVTGP